MNYMAVMHCTKHSVKVTVRFVKKADREYQWIKRYVLSDEKDEELYASLIKDKLPAPTVVTDRTIRNDRTDKADRRPLSGRNTRRKPKMSGERKNNG